MRDLSSITSLAEAQTVSRDCPDCGGGGLATIFHIDYDGRVPFNEVLSDDGMPVKKITRTTCYCACAAGIWVMEAHRKDVSDVFNRMMSLIDVVHNRHPFWSEKDPTVESSPGEVPHRRYLLDWLETFHKRMRTSGVIKQPGASPDVGNRQEAFREMGEKLPEQQRVPVAGEVPF